MQSALGAKLVKYSHGWHIGSKVEWGTIVVAQVKEEQPLGRAGKREFYGQAVHLTRTMQVNALLMSQMADQKASILIGATFVVFSLSVTRLFGDEMTWSLLSLAATAFLSSLFAVLAVIPALGGKPQNPENVNPLFFGHFAEIDEEDWTEDLLDRLADDELLFRSMLRDVYQNGQVLYRRKYRFLTFAYRIFIAGLATTMVIYTLEFSRYF